MGATRGPLRWATDWLKSILFAVVVWLLLRTFVVEAFRIPSGSMENTLLIGDFLFVTKTLYGAPIPLTDSRLPAIREPRRGDIVVFKSVEGDFAVVKRLIGVPGDTVAMQNGVVYRNSARLEEPYVLRGDSVRHEQPDVRARMRAWQVPHLAREAQIYSPDLNDWGPIVVPRESLFVMGDNRDNSYDSRYWGFLPRRNIRGAPILIYFSYDPEGILPLPFLTAIRWKRLFSTPH